MNYNLEGKTFRSVANSDNGDVSGETVFHYRQQGTVVTATYSGGDVLAGHLIAIVLPSGQLAFSEVWQWLSGDLSSGTSELEEVRV